MSTKYHQLKPKIDDYLLMSLPYYLMVGPGDMWEFGHAMEQNASNGRGFMLSCVGRMPVPSWLELV